MLSELQIEYCLAKIREQLTSYERSECRPNVDGLIAVLKRTIIEAYDDTHDEADSIYQIGLNERTAQILERAGFANVIALTRATAKEIMAGKQVGLVMLEEVRSCLAIRGAKLRDDKSVIELRSIYKSKLKLARNEKETQDAKQPYGSKSDC